MSSSRLPGKVMRKLNGKPMLHHVINQAQGSQHVDTVVVLTSTRSEDDPIEEYCHTLNVSVFSGSLHDVLKRFDDAAEIFHADVIVRVTADCPFVDPSEIDKVVQCYFSDPVDYCSNVYPRTVPDGMDVEVVSRNCLSRLQQIVTSDSDREHVTSYIHQHPELFTISHEPSVHPGLSIYKFSVDTYNDFVVAEVLSKELPSDKPVHMDQVVEVFWDRWMT